MGAQGTVHSKIRMAAKMTPTFHTQRENSESVDLHQGESGSDWHSGSR